MQKKSLLLASLTVLATFAIGYFVGHRHDEAGLTTPVVRTYQVSPDRADEIKGQLNSLMDSKEGERAGRVQAFSNGLLIVRAPIGFQQGIQRLIAEMASSGPAPRASIHVDYWIVAGLEDKESNAQSIAPLASVLESIEKADGTRHFKLLEHLATNSSSGQEVDIKGAVTKARTTADAAGELVRLRVDLQSRLGEVRGDTQVKKDDFLVMGQNAFMSDPTAAPLPPLVTKSITGPANVYYILRAR